MDRKNFDKLDYKSQVEYINEKLSLGESLRKITLDIGIQRKTIRERFKKINYIFDKEKNRYIYSENLLDLDEFEDDDNLDILKSNIKTDILEIIEVKDNIFSMLQWFNDYKTNKSSLNISELKIDRDRFEGNVKVTTIRIYSNIKEEFQKFLKKFPEFKSQDIYTEALLEFMEKYQKNR